jgi:hypothetical protein
VALVADSAGNAALASAIATAVLALLTFGYLVMAQRSAKAAAASAKAAEQQLELQQRPVLVLGRVDPLNPNPRSARFADGTVREVVEGKVVAWVNQATGRAYVALYLRNVGTGIALVQFALVNEETNAPAFPPPIEHESRTDLLIPANESRILHRSEVASDLVTAIAGQRPFVLDVGYTDLACYQAAATRAILRWNDVKGEYEPFFGGYQPIGSGVAGLAASAAYY